MIRGTASQASALGSIPIARSINLVDSVALPLLGIENGASWPEFWTQFGPKFLPFAPATYTGVLRMHTSTLRNLISTLYRVSPNHSEQAEYAILRSG